MKWVTRAGANVDRIAYPWLIKKLVDSQAEFLFVSADMVKEVAEKADPNSTLIRVWYRGSLNQGEEESSSSRRSSPQGNLNPPCFVRRVPLPTLFSPFPCHGRSCVLDTRIV